MSGRPPVQRNLEALRKVYGIMPIETVRRKLTERAMKAAGGNKLLASQLLEVPYSTFQDWVRGDQGRFKLNRPIQRERN